MQKPVQRRRVPNLSSSSSGPAASDVITSKWSYLFEIMRAIETDASYSYFGQDDGIGSGTRTSSPEHPGNPSGPALFESSRAIFSRFNARRVFRGYA